MNLEDIHFEQGGVGQLDRIESLWVQLREYHVALSDNFGPHMAKATFSQRKAGLIEKCDGGDLLLDLASIGEDVVGYCITIVDGQQQGELESIYVSDACRGRGIGKQLVKRAMRWLDDRNISQRCVVVAFENQRVMSLYAAAGFEPRLIRMECHNGEHAND